MTAAQGKELSFFDVFRFVAGYWRRQPVKLSLFILFFSLAAFAETALPSALASFLGAVRQQESVFAILTLLAFFIGLHLLKILFTFSAFLAYNRFETRVFRDLMDDAFVHVHRLSEHFFSNNFTGSLISKITRARTRIEAFEDHVFHRILPTSIVLIGSIGFLALRFPFLALAVALYVLLVFAASFFIVTRFGGPAQTAYVASLDANVAQLADSITGIATTKAFAQEKREIASFLADLERLREKNHRTYFYGNMIGVAQNGLLIGMLGLLLGGGTWYFLQGQADVEDMAYLTLAYTIMDSYLRELTERFKDILTSAYDLHAIIRLLDEKPRLTDRAGAPALNVARGAIVFDGVTFSYPGKTKPVFEDFSVSIKAGERVALVGPSGSGKTTFLRLLQRAYDVQAGSILIDGQNIAQVAQASLRSHLALVPQEPILFHRSLVENIAYARPESSLDEVRRAAQRANIDSFIQTLPQGYATLVGERGIKLSGGERQRVAIARAILADRPILILDEATSSLDSVSEKAIQAALHALIQNRTSIMVAHRLSTILDADRILVFDHGKIVEQGAHGDLLALHGLYAHLFRLQSGGFIPQEAENGEEEEG